MEKRFLNLGTIEVRQDDNGEPTGITGHAAVFYDGTPETEFRLFGDVVERIMPGAFDRALEENDDVRALFNHDANHVLGRASAGTLQLSVDSRGLRYDIDPPDTATGRDVMASISRGDVTGSSFSFIVESEDWRREDGTEIREVRGVKLFDVGPVTFPAYEGATTAVRSDDDVSEAMESHEQWKAGVDARINAAQARARVLEIENGLA